MTEMTVQRRLDSTRGALGQSAALLLVVTSLASCGGGSGLGAGNDGSADAGGGNDAAACGTVAACGGDVSGRWNVTATCLTAALDLSNICAGITATIAFSYSGNAVYNANLTYMQTSSVGGAVHYQFPSSCLGTQTCAQVQATLLASNSSVAMGMSFQSATCKSANGGCACDATLSPSPANETGTYSTTPTVLSTVHAGMTDQVSYCVTGNTMHQMPTAAMANVSGSLVLTKQ
jgi:hypothetical protein